jgi:hypothetical protein
MDFRRMRLALSPVRRIVRPIATANAIAMENMKFIENPIYLHREYFGASDQRLLLLSR